MRSKFKRAPKLQLAQSAKPLWQPLPYMQRAVEFLVDHPEAAALFLDPGLGKTAIVLQWLRLLELGGFTGRTLIIAPLRVAKVTWPDEVEKWRNFDVHGIEVLHGSNKEEKLWRTDANILVVNPEGLEWLLGVEEKEDKSGKRHKLIPEKRLKLLFETLQIENLVIDESSKFKKYSSIRSKLLKAIRHRFRRRVILNGTPCANNIEDLFAQFLILDGGHRLGDYITYFRKMFMHQSFSGFGWEAAPDAHIRVSAHVKDIVLRMEAADYLQLPEMTVHPIRFNLEPKVQEIYDTLEEDFIVELEEWGDIEAPDAGARTVKLEQIANGGIYVTKQGEILEKRERASVHIHDQKTEILLDLMEELQGQPLLIAYAFGHDLERLRAAVPELRCLADKADKHAIEDWNAGKVTALALHPASGGHGLNLQGASNFSGEVGHIFWYGLPRDNELFQQTNARLIRQGSAHSRVMIHMPIAADTVDVAKFRSLNVKGAAQAAFLDMFRQYAMEKWENVNF